MSKETGELKGPYQELMHLMDLKEKALDEAMQIGDVELVGQRLAEYTSLKTEMKFSNPVVRLEMGEIGLKLEAKVLTFMQNHKQPGPKAISPNELDARIGAEVEEENKKLHTRNAN